MKRLILTALIIAAVSSIAGAQTPDDTLETIQDNPTPARDPIDLAQRFQGLDTSTLNIELRPEYEVGDREDFTISGSEGAEPRTMPMTLMGATDDVYMWVEDGLSFDSATVQRLAEEISVTVVPSIREHFGTEADIEGDPHIYVLNVTTAGPGIAGVFNDSDRFPDEVFSSSNEINSLIMVVDPSSEGYYLSVLAHEFQHLVQADQDDSEDTWFVEGVAELGSLLALPQYFETDWQEGYVLTATGNQLNSWPYAEDTQLYYGGASLFLTYVTQQYGEAWTRFVAAEPADGVLGIELALEAYGASDDAGEVSFNNIFADFVITNFLNDPTVEDGRFAYTLTPVVSTAPPTMTVSNYPDLLPVSAVNQYGTQYILLNSAEPQTLNVQFEGRDSVAVLPTQPHSGEHFYWSQAGNQGDSILTGRFDLSDAPSATLKYWTWHEIEEGWDYGYVSISTDGGQTWDLLTTPDMTEENPYDRAFGIGYTGLSGETEERPAPYIGIGLDETSLLITDIGPGTPAEAAGLQTEDVLLEINEQAVTAATLTDVLDRYHVGDAVTLLISRNGQEMEVPVTLGAHPERMVLAGAVWEQQSIDLTPYVGGEVMIRFDYVTDQATSLSGWLLDDISIPEIGFSDDFEAESAVWESAGWVRIDNDIPQDYIVQLIDFGSEGTTVERLLMPGEGISGSWQVEVGSGRQAVLAISGAAPVTHEPAIFDLEITSAD